MNQQQLNEIKTRAESALPTETPPDLEKVKAMAVFRKHAAGDVLALVAEVERLRAENTLYLRDLKIVEKENDRLHNEEIKPLRAIERQVRYYLSSDGDTYQAYLKLCEVCGIPPEEPDSTDEYIGELEAKNKILEDFVSRLGKDWESNALQ